jgi:hypothetical protein
MIGPGGILTAIKNVIGSIGDYIRVPYTASAITNTVMAFLQTGYYHIHGRTFIFPDLANDFVLTSGAGAWGTAGAFIELIPENAIDSAFDLHWMDIHNMTEDAEYQVKLYSGLIGAEVEIEPGVRAFRDSVFLAGEETTGARPLQIPQQPSNTRISAKLFSSNAGTAQASINIKGHRYGT